MLSKTSPVIPILIGPRQAGKTTIALQDHQVDFVVSRGKDIWAIEVKSGRSAKTSGLSRFKERYPKAKTLLVGSTGIPLDEFFVKDVAAWFI